MSRVLFISPDYASHYFPMSAVGRSLVGRGHEVSFATGPTLAPTVMTDGFDYLEISLGPGGNSGVIRPNEQSPEELEQLEAFFAATRQGMVPALLHQARNRVRDLLWEPDTVGAELGAILDFATPDAVVVDHLAFGATAALRGIGHPFVAFHPGHPSAIPVGLPYGYPVKIPARIRYEEADLVELMGVTEQVVQRFSAEYTRVVRCIDPSAGTIEDPFAATPGESLIVNYPESLGSGYGLPDGTAFIGSSVRRTIPDDSLTSRLGDRNHRPRIYISLGSFFSARTDLMQKLIAAFRSEPVDVVLATGATDPADLSPIPEHWVVAEYLPQPSVLEWCDLVVTHGGNNTVTEALTAGLPMLVGPLSTDQFSAAADIEIAGLGLVFDPNFDEPDAIAGMAGEVLSGDASRRTDGLGEMLRSLPGQEIAAALVEASLTSADRSSD